MELDEPQRDAVRSSDPSPTEETVDPSATNPPNTDHQPPITMESILSTPAKHVEQSTGSLSYDTFTLSIQHHSSQSSETPTIHNLQDPSVIISQQYEHQDNLSPATISNPIISKDHNSSSSAITTTHLSQSAHTLQPHESIEAHSQHREMDHQSPTKSELHHRSNSNPSSTQAPTETFNPRESLGTHRLRINRMTAEFYDAQVEKLFGCYAYRDRLHSVRLGTLLFGFFVLVYLIFETLAIGSPSLTALRSVQLIGIVIAAIFVVREFRLIKRTPTESLESQRAWQRAFSPNAGRIMDCMAGFLCMWGWATLVPLRAILQNWDEMPVSLIIFSWGAPVVIRSSFLHVLTIHTLGIASFAAVCAPHISFEDACMQVSALTSAAAGGVFLAYVTSIYRRSQLRTILWYYNATPPGTSVHEFMKEEYTRLKANVRGSMRRYRFKNADWEDRFIDFLHNRSIIFVRLTILGLCFTNGLLYIPDSELDAEIQGFAFSIRTYVMFPLWITCLLLTFPSRFQAYRHWIVTTSSILAVGLEYWVMSYITTEQINYYYIMMWRIIDVVCTSFCLPLVNVACVVGSAVLGIIAMVVVGNDYFEDYLNLTLYSSSLAVGLYLSSVMQDDSRMAFLQFAHRIPSSRHGGLRIMTELPFPRPSMITGLDNLEFHTPIHVPMNDLAAQEKPDSDSDEFIALGADAEPALHPTTGIPNPAGEVIGELML